MCLRRIVLALILIFCFCFCFSLTFDSSHSITHFQFHDGGGARAMRWLATYFLSRHLNLTLLHNHFENGSSVTSVLMGDRYCHKVTEKESDLIFRCYENKWDDLMATQHFSSPLSNPFERRCPLEKNLPKNMAHTIFTCPNGFRESGSCGSTFSLESLPNYQTVMKQSLSDWQTVVRKFPRKGFSKEPQCMFTSDAINVVIHLRR
jgi:hypothetical protein